MGYILPINNEQSVQYVNRTTPYQSKYIELHQINKLRLKTQSSQQQTNPLITSQAQTKKQEIIFEKIHAELTGKGLLFNERI
ncbi:hypothetical protein [Fredinandcohnia quinoae]|uniref:Uncharacterized protein n=1 Tax=Fredinandcohnia quinoae TaxID=2918902 RepID=A0AAW5E032_9BACI|nr:hypothetical protein [Fredinandcohnia sp. SECRCQ15]MCH1626266.1 hypothetical protein [Fredinandcohnia sp. SECRCQ15]